MDNVKNILKAALIGFIIAMVIMAAVIFLAYSKAYATGGQGQLVKIFTLPIYEIVKSGNDYSGTTIGTNMGIFSGICIFVSVVIEIIVSKIRKR